MGLTPCTSTITTANGTTVSTTFNLLTNTFSITINPSSPIFSFCVNLPCVNFEDFACTGGPGCGICENVFNETISITGIGGNPGQSEASPVTYTYTFNSGAPVIVGNALAVIEYTGPIGRESLELECAPVCVD